MKKAEEKALRKLIEDWNSPDAMPYSSDSEFDAGRDIGREDAADDLEMLLNKFTKKD